MYQDNVIRTRMNEGIERLRMLQHCAVGYPTLFIVRVYVNEARDLLQHLQDDHRQLWLAGISDDRKVEEGARILQHLHEVMQRQETKEQERTAALLFDMRRAEARRAEERLAEVRRQATFDAMREHSRRMADIRLPVRYTPPRRDDFGDGVVTGAAAMAVAAVSVAALLSLFDDD